MGGFLLAAYEHMKEQSHDRELQHNYRHYAQALQPVSADTSVQSRLTNVHRHFTIPCINMNQFVTGPPE
jgi:hypothetical protein